MAGVRIGRQPRRARHERVTAWEELKNAFWAAVEGAPADQARQIAGLASKNPALAGRLEALLAADARGESLQHLFQSEPARTQPPARIGPYEVIGALGVGGMGEVYRARDSRLHRDVAIKILPVHVTNDPERLARFEREAQVLASLNHPHIAQVYGLEESGSSPALVMELVEGPTLASVLAGFPDTPLLLSRVFEIARQIANGLEAAHDKGIIHRDLKPSNVALTHNGDVKILDFGVAKSLDPRNATRASVATDVGVVLGTPAYMSPEQARGLDVDRRTDIWAFGCLLYELLTGRRPFDGITPADTLAALLTHDPDMTIVPPDTPAEARSLLRACLERDPERRPPDMAAARVAIDEALSRLNRPVESTRTTERAAVPVPMTLDGVSHGRAPRTRVWAAAGAAIVLCLAAIGLWRSPAAPARVAPAQAMTVVPLTTLSGDEYSPAFSPDGEQVAFSWNGEHEDNFDVYIKSVGSATVRRLTSDAGFEGNPSWSPDGKQIAFIREEQAGVRRVYVTSPLGGTELKLGDFAISDTADLARYSSVAWSADPDFVAVAGTPPTNAAREAVRGIYLLPVGRGAPRLVVPARGAMVHFSPAFSRDGRHMAYASCKGVFSCDVYVLDLDSSLAPTGLPRRLTRRTNPSIGQVAWSPDDRSIIYDAEVVPMSNHLWRVAVDGASPPERFEAAGFARLPATARSGDRVAFTEWRFDTDIYRFDPRGPARPMLTSTFLDMAAKYSPDGQRIAFSSGRTAETPEIWVAASDGTGAHQLTQGPGVFQDYPDWSPDGRQIVFQSFQDGVHHLWTIDADGGAPRRVTDAAGDERGPAWSRDGRWIYFTSDDGTGRGVWRVPATGGASTRLARRATGPKVWESADGRRLFYASDQALWAVPAAGGSPQQVIKCVKYGAIAVAASGIYYASCNFQYELNTALHAMDLGTKHDRLIGTIADYFAGLEVSPDEHTIVYNKAANRGLHKRLSVGADLKLIEHFR